MPFQLQIECQVHEEMIAHACAELPNECCGLLGGTFPRQGKTARATHCYPLVNELASPIEFRSEPRSMFEAMRDMRRKGLEVLAIYHSHPSTAAFPSAKDRALSSGDQVVCLIISLRDSVPVVKAWWLTEHGCEEAHWSVVRPS
jgi:proteasome lid subunit RPN8/RPN11